MSREIIDEAKRLLAALDEDTSRTAQLRVLSHALAEARSKPRDWPAFWSSLTDAEAAACLRAAPRVAGEWETRGRWAVRHGVRERVVALCSEAGARSDKRWRWAMCDDAGSPYGYADTADLARSACDAALRAAGWRVL